MGTANVIFQLPKSAIEEGRITRQVMGYIKEIVLTLVAKELRLLHDIEPRFGL